MNRQKRYNDIAILVVSSKLAVPTSKKKKI